MEIDGEWYKITEVNLHFQVWDDTWNTSSIALPLVKTIIFPETITRILNSEGHYGAAWLGENFDKRTERIILPESLTTIDSYAFWGYNLKGDIYLPNTIIEVGERAFDSYSELTTINCEAISKPSGWSDDWSPINNVAIHWGVSK